MIKEEKVTLGSDKGKVVFLVKGIKYGGRRIMCAQALGLEK
jgi:hypothetical protein